MKARAITSLADPGFAPTNSVTDCDAAATDASGRAAAPTKACRLVITFAPLVPGLGRFHAAADFHQETIR